MATIEPLINGIMSANKKGNQPKEKNAFSLRPLVIPMSNKKMARKPLNKSLVKGFMPSACLAFAMYPITKLPSMSKTLPLVNECLMTPDFCMVLTSALLNMDMSNKPIM